MGAFLGAVALDTYLEGLRTVVSSLCTVLVHYITFISVVAYCVRGYCLRVCLVHVEESDIVVLTFMYVVE